MDRLGSAFAPLSDVISPTINTTFLAKIPQKAAAFGARAIKTVTPTVKVAKVREGRRRSGPMQLLPNGAKKPNPEWHLVTVRSQSPDLAGPRYHRILFRLSSLLEQQSSQRTKNYLPVEAIWRVT
jgi:hypothetical protein